MARGQSLYLCPGIALAEIIRACFCSETTLIAECPSFLTWIWIQILTACSGGGGLSGRRMLGLASGAQQTQEDNELEVWSRIAASKSTWSEVPGRDIHHSVAIPSPSEFFVWEELKASVPHFFCDDWGGYLVLGRLIGEGGQAQIFKAKVEGIKDYLVLKVFKLEAGSLLVDLKHHWICCMMKGEEDCSESMLDEERSFGFVLDYCEAIIIGFKCFILDATLQKDGRFAFWKWRYWRDLCTLIDLKCIRSAQCLFKEEDFGGFLKFCKIFKRMKKIEMVRYGLRRWMSIVLE